MKTIGHLSHGITETGGYRHEQQLLDAMTDFYVSHGLSVSKHTIRIKQYFKGLGHLKLQWWSFINASFDVNIVVARCALSAMIRNCFNAKKILIVLHNYDQDDYKTGSLALYYRLLFWVLRSFSFKHVTVVAVSPFWVNEFKHLIHHKIPVFLFPNLFSPSAYYLYRTGIKQKQIHLGQYSLKNDPHVFELAKRLTAAGYTCYFSTLNQREQGKFEGYEVRFSSFEHYLSDMASSEYTVAYIAVNEGWNRIAHESLLVGTPVIGVNKGGLGDLLKESGSLIASSVDEFFALIHSTQKGSPAIEFLNKYDTNTRYDWVKPLAFFCESK